MSISAKIGRSLPFIWNFIRHHPTVVYSILLLLVVPTILVGYAIWVISSYQTVVEVSLQRQATVIHQLIEQFIVAEDPALSQQQITLIQQTAGDDIIDFTLLKRDEANGSFIPTAGFSSNLQLDSIYTNVPYALAWAENQSFATYANHPTTDERLLLVTKPIRTTQGRWGLATLALSLSQHDAMVSSVLTKSFIILIVAVLIILLLIANHFRLFHYATELERHTEMDKVRDDFISVASHELRTPITGMISFLSLVGEGSFGQLSDKGKEYVKQALTQSDKLNALVNHMLDVSRIEQGRVEYNWQILDPKTVIKEVVDQLQFKAQAKKLQLKFEGSTTHHIKADTDHLRRIITNLIGNAIKYTPQGAITVSLSDYKRNKVSIVVKDSGIGIPPDEVATLFRKFSRVHSGETASIQGTGLGLWITKALIEKMGGEIYIASIHGQGSEFTVFFPAAKSNK